MLYNSQRNNLLFNLFNNHNILTESQNCSTNTNLWMIQNTRFSFFSPATSSIYPLMCKVQRQVLYNTGITSSQSTLINAFVNAVISTLSKRITNHRRRRKKYVSHFTYLKIDLSGPVKQDDVLHGTFAGRVSLWPANRPIFKSSINNIARLNDRTY